MLDALASYRGAGEKLAIWPIARAALQHCEAGRKDLSPKSQQSQTLNPPRPLASFGFVA